MFRRHAPVGGVQYCAHTLSLVFVVGTVKSQNPYSIKSGGWREKDDEIRLSQRDDGKKGGWMVFV